jgi:hypothetical protein
MSQIVSHHSRISITTGSQLQFSPQRTSFEYTFPQPYSSTNEQIALESLSIYYSWNNLTTTFNNLQGASYVWPGDGQTYNVVFPEGIYTGSDINGYIQFTMKGHGHYLLDSTSSEVYYLNFTVNPILYGYTLTLTPVPTSLPVGYSNPGGMTFPVSTATPQLVVSPSTNWYKLLGYRPATYPPTPSDIPMNYNSTLIPIKSPITHVNVLCDWVNDSRFTMNSSCISSFIPNVQSGALISFSPPPAFYNIDPKVYTSITVRLTDQSGNPLVIKDYERVIFNLIIK